MELPAYGNGYNKTPKPRVAFASGITAATLMDRPHRCKCVWVPKGKGFALKYTNGDCPVLAHAKAHG